MDLIRQGFANIWNAITGGIESTENGMRRRSAQSRATQLATGGNMVAKGAATKEVGHLALDVVGMSEIPALSQGVDAGNALWYLTDSEYGNAALSGFAILPVIGSAATGTK